MKKNKLKKELLEIAPQILKFSKPVWKKIDEFKNEGKKILFEGAQRLSLRAENVKDGNGTRLSGAGHEP